MKHLYYAYCNVLRQLILAFFINRYDNYIVYSMTIKSLKKTVNVYLIAK